MKKKLRSILFIVVIVGILLSFTLKTFAIDNVEMEVQKSGNSLFVKARIIPSIEFVDDFKNGLSKNIFVSIELFRRWSIIPDEFIKGFQIQRVLISDPVKEEFFVKNTEAQNLKEKRFKSWQEALDSALKIDSLKIIDINNVERGKYYIKITIESNIKKLPTVLEHLLFFIPTYEKKITKESEIFKLP